MTRLDRKSLSTNVGPVHHSYNTTTHSRSSHNSSGHVEEVGMLHGHGDNKHMRGIASSCILHWYIARLLHWPAGYYPSRPLAVAYPRVHHLTILSTQLFSVPSENVAYNSIKFLHQIFQRLVGSDWSDLNKRSSSHTVATSDRCLHGSACTMRKPRPPFSSPISQILKLLDSRPSSHRQQS